MDYRRKPWAYEAQQVTVWGAAELEADPDFIGLQGSPTVVAGLANAPVRARRRAMLTGSVEEMVGELVQILRRVR